MATTETQYRDDERTFVRVPLTASVRCAYDDGHEGSGMTSDVSRGGLSLRLQRYVRPGRFVLLQVNEPTAGTLELKAEIAWCRPEGPSGTFRAGLRVIHDEPAALEGLSRLVHAAVLPAIGWTVVPPAPTAPNPNPEPTSWTSGVAHTFAATA